MVDKSLLKWIEQHQKLGYTDEQLKQQLKQSGYDDGIINENFPHPFNKKKNFTSHDPIFIGPIRTLEVWYESQTAMNRQLTIVGLSVLVAIFSIWSIKLFSNGAYGFVSSLEKIAFAFAPLGGGMSNLIANLYAYELPLIGLLIFCFCAFELVWINGVGFITSHIIETITTDVPLKSVKRIFRASQIITIMTLGVFCFVAWLTFLILGVAPTILTLYAFPIAHILALFTFAYDVHARSQAHHRRLIWFPVIVVGIIGAMIGVVLYILALQLPAQLLIEQLYLFGVMV